MSVVAEHDKISEEHKLRWTASSGCVNLVDWIKNRMPAYCKTFDKIQPWMVDVIYTRYIPPELVTPYSIPAGSDALNGLELSREKTRMQEHDSRVKDWKNLRGYLIGKIKETMSVSSINRTQDVYPTEYEDAIRTDDVLKLLELIENSHMIQNRVASLGDTNVYLTEFHTFKRRNEDNLTEHKARYRALIERGKALQVAIVLDPIQVIYMYLSSLSDYPVSEVRARVLGHLANSHKKGVFPSDLEELHNDIISLDQQCSRAGVPTVNPKIFNIKVGGQEYQLVDDGKGNYVNALSLSERLKAGDHNKKGTSDNTKKKDPKYNTNQFIKRHMEKRKCSREDIIKELKCPQCNAIGDHIARDCTQKKAKVNSTISDDKDKSTAKKTEESSDGNDPNSITPQQWINLINFGQP